MNVGKQQIINGIAAYMQEEILPKMGQDKALQIGLSVAVNAIKANGKLIDAVFDNEIIKSVLEEDGAGRYEIGPIAEEIKKSVTQWGELPLAIPPIPLIAPRGATIKLDAEDITALHDKILEAEE